MQPVTMTPSLAPMTPTTGYSGPGPARMLRSVIAVAETSAKAAVANAIVAPRPRTTGFHMTEFLAMDPVDRENVARQPSFPGGGDFGAPQHGAERRQK